MTEMTDADMVAAQYAAESRLETRRSVWQPDLHGQDPSTTALRTLVAAAPADVLEIGCGTGAFAARLALALPLCRVTATDASARMVELTRARGVESRVASAAALPYADDSYDAVAALWMLYHVADLDRALGEVHRVLRPGGLFVAVTNGDGHLADLLAEAGGEPNRTGFSRENGAAILRRHFGEVEQVDIDTRACFVDHAAARDYLATFAPELAAGLPPFEGAREYAGATSVFTCSY